MRSFKNFAVCMKICFVGTIHELSVWCCGKQNGRPHRVAPTALRSDFDEFNFFRFTFFLYKIIFFCQYFMYKEKMRVME